MSDADALSAPRHGTTNPALIACAYWVDTWQRSILMLDTLRQRGNTYLEQAEKIAPHVLSFGADLVLDGREFERPVNYLLARIRPPEGVKIDHNKRPFIVFDPRAGHGPGIGGMKQDSEIGVAMRAGHPCYFVGFLPEPVHGQTIEDVCVAEARFIQHVIEIEPDAAGKPCLIGNCQAGWQIMLTAAISPDLSGPIILAGSPLSYWAGVHGKNPMRYLGGLLGGTWMTSLAGDLGHGIFDGAHLVANFERLHPDNTFLEKAYNVYSKIDTEPQRFLDFETWWGSPVLLDAGEMQWIADNLFVGNKLGTGAITTTSGERVDLRNITSPILIFCSWGDDITPPQQALGWLLDVYQDVDDLIQTGQTVVYTVHETIGHLGIFVSGKVATKEHAEFASCIDMIDLLPPGLYEAVISDAGPETARADLIEGKYLLALEPRTLDDIRAFGTNSPEDEADFATVARVSEINKGLYKTFASPLVRRMTTEASAQWLRSIHPHRLRFSAISDRNPAAPIISWAAKNVRAHRRPVGSENPLRQWEEIMASQMAHSLQLWGQLRDRLTEQVFQSTYSSPVLQALVGMRAEDNAATTHVVRDVTRRMSARELRKTLRADMDHGDLTDAILRSVLYIAGGGNGSADERSYSTLKRISAVLPPNLKVGTDRFKESMRKQFLTLRLDRRQALETLPELLPDDASERRRGLAIVRALFESRNRTDAEAKRFEEVSHLFDPSAAHVVHRSARA
ncbi:MAG: hypothetical protein JWL62_1243 [Hyphomicrobiales bacterium]|nr:hypothetical protein [Hyphomicrobiales bacterium]